MGQHISTLENPSIMTEKPMTGEVTVNEVRFGLFRVVWNLLLKMVVDVKYHQEFLLCGTQSGKNFKISTKNGSYFNIFTLRCISCDHSASQSDKDEQSESKRIKLEEQSVLPELKSLHSVEVMYLGKSEFLTGNETSKWKFHTDQLLLGEEPVIELWIDFGTSEVGEKIVINGLSEIFNKQTLCDVIFKFKNGDEIGAHVAILTAGSPVFAAMLQSNFIESKSRIVNIADIEMDVFKEMLVHLYTGIAPNLLEINFTRSVYEVADKYGVKSLKDDCENLLVSRLSNNNAIELLIWAQFHSQPKLIKKAILFIVKNSEEFCFQADWLVFMNDHPNLCQKINQRMAKLIASGYNHGFYSD
jgi:speckle-type POZ protein